MRQKLNGSSVWSRTTPKSLTRTGPSGRERTIMFSMSETSIARVRTEIASCRPSNSTEPGARGVDSSAMRDLTSSGRRPIASSRPRSSSTAISRRSAPRTRTADTPGSPRSVAAISSSAISPKRANVYGPVSEKASSSSVSSANSCGT